MIGLPILGILGLPEEYAVFIGEKELVLKVPLKYPGHVLPWNKITKVSFRPMMMPEIE